MKKICVITATRAEYGLLAPIIRKLREYESAEFITELIVCGTHLSDDYGMTVHEIEKDELRIDHLLYTPVDSFTARDISCNQATVLTEFASLFHTEHYDGIIILGDRYEMLAIAIAAGNAGIPIFHISGGDTTEGAIDEWIRHCITKISYLHFVTNEDSRKRVIQLGESPDRVFNYGSTSIDNIMHMPNISKCDILKTMGLDECRYAVCTYHPVTLEDESPDKYIHSFIDAMAAFPYITFIITKSNSDAGGARINELLAQATYKYKNLHLYDSLGACRYLSLLKYAEFVLGNSSSGVVEAPALHIPTVNIGSRQRGRLSSESVINCEPYSEDIIKAINTVESNEHREICRRIISPYGDGHSAEKIAFKIFHIINNERIDLKKKFYDLQIL